MGTYRKAHYIFSTYLPKMKMNTLVLAITIFNIAMFFFAANFSLQFLSLTT